MTNAVIWARVSSREQREGYSIDAQLRLTREKARCEGWTVIREFEVAESAKRGAEREVFNDMYKWVRGNARRCQIGYIVSHKLDRVCRNMRDAVRMQELEDSCGVHMAFVDNHFGPGAAGAFSFNVMAAVAQYYSDNLRTEVIKGIDERARQGWPAGLAPFGYRNVKGDREAPVQPHPTNIKAVQRIFELYASGTKTFAQIADILAQEGFVYRPCQPRFTRSVVAAILDNRLYIGQVVRHGEVYPGKFPVFIDHKTFDRCQEIKRGKNRRTGSPDLYLAGGQFKCAVCGYSMTGERVRRPLSDGTIKEYLYYRCGNIEKPTDHKLIRWRVGDLEKAVMGHLAAMRVTKTAARDWFRQTALSALEQRTRLTVQRAAAIRKRVSDLKTMAERLLGMCLSGAIDEATYTTRIAAFQKEQAVFEGQLQIEGATESLMGRASIALLSFLDQPGEAWCRVDPKRRRELLAVLTVNRRVTTSGLQMDKLAPFGWEVRTESMRDTLPLADPNQSAGASAVGPPDTQSCCVAVWKHPGLTSWELSHASGIDAHMLARRLPDLRRIGRIGNGGVRTCRVKLVVSQTWIPLGDNDVSVLPGCEVSCSTDAVASSEGYAVSLPAPSSSSSDRPLDGWITHDMIAWAQTLWAAPQNRMPTEDEVIEMHRNVKRLVELVCPED